MGNLEENTVFTVIGSYSGSSEYQWISLKKKIEPSPSLFKHTELLFQVKY